MVKKNIDLKEFKNKYLIENLTVPECANYFNCGKTTIVRFCQKHKIKKPHKLKYANISKARMVHDHDLVKDLYFNKNMNKKEIANKLNIKHGAVAAIVATDGRKKSKAQLRDLQLKLKVSKDELYNLYIEKNKSMQELCNFFNVGCAAVNSALKRANIKKPENLRIKLVLKTFKKSGKAKTINNFIIKDISDKIGLSITCINRFIKENSHLSDEETLKQLKDLKQNNISTLENIIIQKLDMSLYNKKIKTGYKPDFKLTNKDYLNVDGLYWHSEAVKEDKHYHFNMRKSYEEQGFRILQFREDEIIHKFPIVSSMINNILNKNDKIYARNTTVKETQQKEASNFLNQNHMMGDIKAKHVGLYKDDELIMIMSYKQYKKDKTLKIERMCSKTNTSVVGGFSKLLKYLEKNTNPRQIDYWVDLRYGTGDFLLNHDFSHSHDTLGWKWTNFMDTYNRQKIKAKMDDRNLSERQYANELGFVKIYDAGQRLYRRCHV